MAATAEILRNEIMESGYVLDPEGTHHEFVSGMHGQKLDFDKIDSDSDLYGLWTETAANFIRKEFPRLPEVIIGVANGTNRTALDTARHFDGNVLGLVSQKDPRNHKQLFLNKLASKTIRALKPELVVVLEDVGTTGSNSVQVALGSRAAGAKNVEVVTTWQRRENLEKLEAADVPYRAIINEPLTTYTPEECREEGFCSQDWEFIERSK